MKKFISRQQHFLDIIIEGESELIGSYDNKNKQVRNSCSLQFLLREIKCFSWRFYNMEKQKMYHQKYWI